jgi:hypothetical protein
VTPVRAIRYVTPLREGGSLPGLMEADDLGTYVVKFRGAGQGPLALVAEVICAGLARGLGLAVPRWAPIELPPELAPAEPDEEVQHLLRASAGLNLGVDFLPGALDVGPMPAVDPRQAGRIIWFDALIGNRDRSWRNPNMLLWHRTLYLIDHGAALTFHHSWTLEGLEEQRDRCAAQAYGVADHALVECAPDVASADAEFADVEWDGLVRSAVEAVPDQWLVGSLGTAASGGGAGAGEPRDSRWVEPGDRGGAVGPAVAPGDRTLGTAGEVELTRAAYRAFLLARVAARGEWVPDLASAVASGAARDSSGHRVAGRPSSGPPEWIPALRIGREGRT